MTDFDEPIDAEIVFRRRESAGTKATWWLLGGIGLLVLAAAGFLAALVGRVDELRLHAMTTLPAILAVAALSAAWLLAQSPGQVSVSAHGLTAVYRRRTRSFGWEQLGWASVGEAPLNARRRLVIYDQRGKRLATFGDSFDAFDHLVSLVQQRVAQHSGATARQIQAKKSRRTAVLSLATGVFLMVATVFVAWDTRETQEMARRLAAEGTPGKAEIVRRFLAPNGVTCRVEYRVTTPDGRSDTRNVEVEPAYWKALEGQTQVPIVYVPDKPQYSRLAFGEVVGRRTAERPLFGYGLAAVGAALALICLAGSVMLWNGRDVHYDSTTRRWSLQRFGESVRQ